LTAEQPYNFRDQATVLIAITIMVAITVWAAAHVLLQRPPVDTSRVAFDNAPDRPAAFGTDMAWLAVRSKDAAAVAEHLGLLNVVPANWQTGIGAVYHERLGEQHIYVTPPINGWVFVVGMGLPAPVGRRFVDKSTPLLLALGREYVEVQYFFGYPMLDFFAWARVIEGKVVRAFAIGDEGVIWNRGKPTREEIGMGLKWFELRGVKGRKGDAGGELLLVPTEGHMMQLAAKWSMDPTKLGTHSAPPATGFIGVAPALWRAERAQKAA
jgi:hypothetical protein